MGPGNFPITAFTDPTGVLLQPLLWSVAVAVSPLHLDGRGARGRNVSLSSCPFLASESRLVWVLVCSDWYPRPEAGLGLCRAPRAPPACRPVPGRLLSQESHVQPRVSVELSSRGGEIHPLFWEQRSTLAFLLSGGLVCLSGEPCLPHSVPRLPCWRWTHR